MKTTYYVCAYEQYPIYEPAEGGYYYDGTQIVMYKKTRNLKKARRWLREWAREYYECEGKLTEDAREYIDNANNHIYYMSKYIGDGMEWHIETVFGKNEHGWHPYC